ncbi:helix-turn-helix domain-containing protein [Paenibacillus sp. HB172176]|uniref:helix-turn-helix domain-containing protein n=1 Tax=Paenibacillus sp. HB172176 TaxID=2493690 RepID=UPI001439AB37|nr:helix-turn-helix domain-containing protein [Paenibacillus sp. HB172176]
MNIIRLLKQRRNNRLFLKILGYFLSLLIPILIVGLFTYHYSLKIMKEDFDGRILSNLRSSSATVDFYIKTAQETALDFMNDDTIQSHLLPKAERTIEINSELWKVSRIIQRSENIVSVFTENMFVYIDDKEVFVNEGINSFDSFFSRLYRYDSFGPDYWREKLKSNKYIEILPASEIERQGGREPESVVPIVITNRIGTGNAVMVLNVSVSSIADALKGNAIFQSTRFIALDGEDRVVYNGAEGTDDGSLLATLHGLDDANWNTIETKWHDRSYIFSLVDSGLYGWKFYSVTPSSEFQKHTYSILQMTLLLCIVLLLMGVVFSFIFSASIYNPIRNIREVLMQRKELWSGDGLPDARMNEFELIKSGISKLYDSHSEYKSKSDRHASDYVEYMLLFLLKGHTIAQEEILVDALRSEYGFTKKRFICCTIRFDFQDAFYADIQDTDRQPLLEGIKKVVWHMTGERLPGYILHDAPNLFTGVFSAEDEGDIRALRTAFEQLLDIFGYDMNHYYDIAIGFGTICDSVNALGSSYNAALTAIGKSKSQERFRIVDANELEIGNRYFYSFFDEQKLLNLMNVGEGEGVTRVIDDVLEANSNRNISYEHRKLLFHELHRTCIRFLSEKGLEPKEALDGATLPPLRQDWNNAFLDMSEWRTWLIASFDAALDAVKQTQKGKSGDLASRITAFVQEHYREDLGLERIADEMGVSVKYVSRVFKEKSGVVLTDYINQVRIDKAKELLASTTMRINDIAEEVGIYSRTTFLRSFKKVEGMSPNEFRAMSRN